MKADDNEKYEEDGKQKEEKYTNFEHLKAKVEVLQKCIETIGRVLKQRGITKITEEVDMIPDFEDETYKRIEQEQEQQLE